MDRFQKMYAFHHSKRTENTLDEREFSTSKIFSQLKLYRNHNDENVSDLIRWEALLSCEFLMSIFGCSLNSYRRGSICILQPSLLGFENFQEMEDYFLKIPSLKEIVANNGCHDLY